MSVTSVGHPIARPPDASISVTTSSSSAVDRAAMATLTPFAASCCAVARPIPRPPPVTRATLSFRSITRRQAGTPASHFSIVVIRLRRWRATCSSEPSSASLPVPRFKNREKIACRRLGPRIPRFVRPHNDALFSIGGIQPHLRVLVPVGCADPRGTIRVAVHNRHRAPFHTKNMLLGGVVVRVVVRNHLRAMTAGQIDEIPHFGFRHIGQPVCDLDLKRKFGSEHAVGHCTCPVRVPLVMTCIPRSNEELCSFSSSP